MTPEKKPEHEKKAAEHVKPKAETKTEKPAKAEHKTATKKKERKLVLKRPQKTVEAKALSALIREKSRLPSFKGRFGVESIRNPHKEKWSKWRKPRGIDIQRLQEDGARPNIGYRRPTAIRYVHPSGYRELLVFNPQQLSALGKENAARIGGKVGKKKRRDILLKASELGVYIVNPLKK